MLLSRDCASTISRIVLGRLQWQNGRVDRPIVVGFDHSSDSHRVLTDLLQTAATMDTEPPECGFTADTLSEPETQFCEIVPLMTRIWLFDLEDGAGVSQGKTITTLLDRHATPPEQRSLLSTSKRRHKIEHHAERFEEAGGRFDIVITSPNRIGAMLRGEEAHSHPPKWPFFKHERGIGPRPELIRAARFQLLVGLYPEDSALFQLLSLSGSLKRTQHTYMFR